ncbi:hypothetical protein MHF_0235 [Mycoplasma haemofelis Ohio2]|uniref:Uncharacterized protein n=1 Tax=Mycoplasma haemofelis (strain Ohio2) TaxID=859194 RepID=F6FGE0_MYCHI|nr:hypothetical protein MHF_0235 [Mycoplasma haemofelis Ohio2]
MTSASKLLIGGAATTGVIGVSSVAYTSPREKPTTIRQALEKEGRTVLSSSDSRWEIKAHAYTSMVAKDPTLKIYRKDTVTAVELSRYCLETLEGLNEKRKYKKAKELCLAPTVKDKLSKEGKSISSDLSSKLSSYKSHSTNDDKTIPPEQIGNKTNGNVTDEEFKKWCNTYSEVELTEGTDKNYERIVHWCTN